MNQTWQKSLKFHYKRLYYGQPQIDIEQLDRALAKNDKCKKNKFPTHAIKNTIVQDDKSTQDKATFEDLSSRILRTLKDQKDSIFIQTYFDLADENGDGFITHQKLMDLAQELGMNCMSQKTFNQMAEKISQQGTKFSKSEGMAILREYL